MECITMVVEGLDLRCSLLINRDTKWLYMKEPQKYIDRYEKTSQN